MDKIKIFAICGRSCSGKTTITNIISKFKFLKIHKIISHTTRKPRAMEVDGVHYHFIDTETFTEKLLSHDLIEATEFNNCFYGTSYSHLAKDKINIGIFTPDGIEILLGDPRFDLKICYIDVDETTRIIREIKRNWSIQEILKRENEDNLFFSNLGYDIKLTNNRIYDIIICVGKIIKEIVLWN